MKFIYAVLFGLMINLPLSAQDKNRHQQIETVKIAFITQKLNLTTAEAEKFWPLYNNYQSEMRQIFRARKDARQNNQNDNAAQLDGELDFEGRMLEVRKKYKSEFSRALPASKVGTFFEAEREFREHMIKELKDRRSQ